MGAIENEKASEESGVAKGTIVPLMGCCEAQSQSKPVISNFLIFVSCFFITMTDLIY